MSEPLNEECMGCGWDFSDGGEHHKSRHWDGGAYVSMSICDVCHHNVIDRTTGGLRQSQNLPDMIARCTNLILAEIRERSLGDGSGK